MIEKVRPALGHVIPPLAALVAILIAWEVYIAWKDVSLIVMPPPSAVGERFSEDPGFFLREGLWTLYEATLGLAAGSAVAILLAILMAHSRLAERAIFPLAILIKVTPLVAIAPILVIILGFGTTPKIVVAALLSFFPVLVNAMAGFRDVSPQALDFMRSIRATTWQVFWKLRLPSSHPHLFTAVKIAYPLALIGAVVAEWFTGDRGLGLVIYIANANLDTPTLFAAIAVLAITGVLINAGLTIAERRMLFWHDSVRSGN